MSSTNFQNGTVVEADWLNDVDEAVYKTIPELLARDNESVDILDYCAGDGVTDDTEGMLAALSTGKVVDGLGLSYKITAKMILPVGCSPKLQNATILMDTIDASTATAFAIYVTGEQGTATELTADTATGDLTCTVASTAGLSEDGWVFMSSNVDWGTATGSKIEFIARIRTISGTTITFHEQLPYALTTNGTAPTLSPLTMVEDSFFHNVTFIGQRMAVVGSTGNYLSGAIYFNKCLAPVVSNVKTIYCNYAGIVFFRCVEGVRIKGYSNMPRAFGLAYGTSIAGGSVNTKVISSGAYDCRHAVTVGDNDGINRNTVVVGNTFLACRDAGVDSHESGDYLVVASNYISTSSLSDGLSGTIGDGIISQAPNLVCTNNIIVNPARYGVFYQITAAVGGQTVITGNTIRMSNTVASTAGIYVANQTFNAAAIQGVTVSNNNIRGSGSYAIFVYAISGNISGVSITDNEASQFTASVEAIRVRAALANTSPAITIDKVAISGGTYKTSGVYAIRCFSDADDDGAGPHVAGVLSNLSILGVNTDGGTYGVACVNVTGASVSNLNCINSTNILLLTGSTGVKLNGAYYGTAVYDPPSLADGAGATTTVTVTGAALGDLATATFSLNLQGIMLTSWVSAANTVSVRFQNESGGVLDLGSGTLRCFTTPALI